jgi:poly-gamma-glutamate capsule biosynthesis protein CapA/YwtB (metallophosphatase superfamily)
MEPARRPRKPYTVYRSEAGAAAEAAPPPRWPRPTASGGGRPPRRGRRRRRGGLLLLVVVLVVFAALAGVALATLRPFDAGASATASTAVLQSTAATAEPTDAAASPTADPTPTPTSTPTAPAGPAAVTVTGGGDVIGGFGVSGVVGSMGSGLFRSIAPYFESSDFGFVNLESPLTYGGDPQGWKDVVIKGNPALAPAMAKSGIDVVTMANNHAGDMGDSGLLDSFRYCAKAGVNVVGAGKNLKAAQAGAVLKSKDGVRTAFLGFSDVLPAGYPATSGSPGTSPGRSDIGAVKANIRAAAKKSDYVFVGWHWNLEYKRAPSSLESSEGKAAIDAGADIVFAHHPHLLDGVQAYHGGLICYSLGNLVFSGFAGETAQTVLVKAKVTPHTIDVKLIPVRISGSGVPTVATGSTGLSILQRVKSLSAALGTTVKISGGRGYVHVKR